MNVRDSFALFLLVLALATGGCATKPLYDWRAAADPPLPPTPLTMPDALKHLEKARSGYHEAVKQQMNDEAAVSKAVIIGAGMLMTAAGLNAHRDVLLAGGAITGTTYALGNAQLPRARALAYLSGIEALNCVEAGVAAIRVIDYTALKNNVTALDTAIETLAARIDDIKAKYDKDPLTWASAQQPLDMATKTLNAGKTVSASTKEFLVKTNAAAGILYGQVEKIDKAVTQAVVNSTPDLSQVKMVASGLGASINGIVAKAASDASTSRSTPSGPVSQSGGGVSDVDKALASLATDQGAVRNAIAAVKSTLPSNYETLDAETIKQCGLAVIPATFTSDPGELHFFAKVNKTQKVDLRGGTKEYIAETGSLPEGVTVKQPGPAGTSMEVTVDGAKVIKAIPRFELRLHDQTPGGNGVIIGISVSPPAETTPAPAAKDDKAPVKKAAKPAKTTNEGEAVTIFKLGNVTADGKTYKINTSEAQAGGKSIAVSVCGKPPAGTLDAIGKAIRAKIPGTSAINVTSDPGC